MRRPRDLKGVPGWIAHRFFNNYWLLAVCAVLTALPFAYGVLWFDRAFATDWLLDHDLGPVATADTAKDFLGVAAGVNAAFITLYFSITLIVLSMAASNLGVRLIDRWVERKLVRVSLAGLSFTLVVSLTAMLTVDAEADLEDVPLLLTATVLGLQALNVAMLSVSLHDLARTMFVDSSIDAISQDARSRSVGLQAADSGATDWAYSLHAPREGYIEDVAQDRLSRIFGRDGDRVRVEAPPGQHVMRGEVILRATRAHDDEEELWDLMPIGPYRSDNQGVVFQVRLLVEIAARALSPAINDFYTAITCADKMTAIIASQTGTWIPDDAVPVLERHPQIEVPGQDFKGLFEDPLSAFRQAASQYPSVAIRMIDNYGRVARAMERDGHAAGLVDFLRQLARELSEHAASVADYECDKADIRAALDRCDGGEIAAQAVE